MSSPGAAEVVADCDQVVEEGLFGLHLLGLTFEGGVVVGQFGVADELCQVEAFDGEVDEAEWGRAYVDIFSEK